MSKSTLDPTSLTAQYVVPGNRLRDIDRCHEATRIPLRWRGLWETDDVIIHVSPPGCAHEDEDIVLRDCGAFGRERPSEILDANVIEEQNIGSMFVDVAEHGVLAVSSIHFVEQKRLDRVA